MQTMEILAPLKSQIGKEIHVGPWLTVTQDRINQFAEATGDKQWIHVDPKRAQKESPYGTTIAHGFFTLSLISFLMGTVTQDKPDIPGIKWIVNYGLNKVRFPNPVKAGSRIRARTELQEVEEVTGGARVFKKVTVEVEGESKPACVAETITQYFF